MSNIFTRRSSLPRTVTLSDYGFKSHHYFSTEPRRRVYPRIHSPTRRQNPQPNGLNYQSPYNRELQSFVIWNPDQALLLAKRRNTFNHLKKTNFSCNHDSVLLQNRLDPDHQRSCLTVEKTDKVYNNTLQRDSYQWPKNFPEEIAGKRITTRYGHSPRYPLVGIVPNTIASNRIPAIVDKNMTIDQFLEMERKHQEGRRPEIKHILPRLS